MNKLAIIGGTGLASLEGAEIINSVNVDTPFGKPSSELTIAKVEDKEIIFLPRHGNPHTIPPHKVNYRANIHALKEQGVTDIIAVNAVGGITREMSPEKIVIPEQIIDYTYGRKQTFFEDDLDAVTHIDFTHPYCPDLSKQLATASLMSGVDAFIGGVYAATQGPRLETAAEITRLEKDGCDIVGMTGMPEATLARELDINYACLALVVNWAAGKTGEIITMEIIEQNLNRGIDKVKSILSKLIADYQ